MKIVLRDRVIGDVVSITDCKSCNDQTPYVVLNNKGFDVKWLDQEIEKYAYEMALTFNQKEALETHIFPYRISDFIDDMRNGFGLKIVDVGDDIILEEIEQSSKKKKSK